MSQKIAFCTCPDGARIAYSTMGQGSPLVYLSGWVSHLELEFEEPYWRSFYEKLSRNHTIIRYDRRGIGLSDWEKNDFSLEADLLDLESIISLLKIELFDLMGLSQSGPIAINYAAKHPSQVTHLILYGTFASGKAVAKDEIKKSLVSIVRHHWGMGSRTLSDLFVPEADRTVETVKWYIEYQKKCASSDMAADLLEAMYSWEVANLLPSIQVPTIVIHRNKDRAIPSRQGREIAASIPDAQFVLLDGNIHFPYMGDTDSVLRVISNFLGDPFPKEDDRQLITILFTDIVSSTQKAAELGDQAWKELLEQHHALVRNEFIRFQGREIDAAGDGFFATFDRPAKAIQCACKIKDSVSNLGVEIRAGLHTGECEVTGDTVRGIAVHIGARVMAIAQGGEILVTNTVKDMVAGSNIHFEDRGTHELKGIPDEWRLYAVQANCY